MSDAPAPLIVLVDQARIPALEDVFHSAQEKGLKYFIRAAWEQVEPAQTFTDGWHIDAICDHLEAVTRGELEKLVINVPPGHAKSLLTGVFWPAWAWTAHPHLRWIFGSYAANLSIRDSIKMRELLLSDWYQARWGDKVKIKATKDTQAEYETSMGGFRYATSVGGSVTGRHAHVQVIDDPLSALQAYSEAERASANLWVDSTLSTRWVPGEPQKRVVVMQRLHEDDPTGHLLRQGGYEHLCLPAEYEPRTYSMPSAINWTDPRTAPGELLWPALYPKEKVDALKRQLGSYGAAGQLQQRPAPADGGVLKRTSFKTYRAAELPAQFDRVTVSVDANFGETVSNDPDYVVIQVWGSVGAMSYLIRQIRDRFNYPQTKAALRQLRKAYPNAYQTIIEKKANGAALISELKGEIPGLVEYSPKDSKLSRVHAVVPQIEAGQVWLPHPDDEPWIDAFYHEAAAFPAGSHDDQVDAMAQYLITHVNSDLGYFLQMASR